jgi:serine/threonine protein phosphatase PrpC
MRMLAKYSLSIACAAWLGGCAEGKSIHHSRTSIADNKKDPIVICGEATPDSSSALAAIVNDGLGSAPGSKEGQATGTTATAENARTLEREQTLDLMRESMHRTCERWLSGAISKEEFIVQSARDRRAINAILALEQLTGGVERGRAVSGETN